jgi:5-formyltetrahydrofolate cyclo-ligase
MGGNILKMPQYKKAKNILSYAAFGNEANLERIMQIALNEGKRIFLPVLMEDNHFEAREHKKDIPTTKNAFGILEPKDGELIEPEKLDLILVPGLAFDNRLHRIGFGAGYYDRYLFKAKNAFKLGAAYAFQIVDYFKEESHDVCLDAIASERDILYRV